MRKTNKKGFTIVELVVVVAVIAILAAVLIPTFSGIIKKANLSKDQQAIANMNKVVAEEASLDEFDYAGDAVNALYAHGYNAGKLLAFTKDHHYAYSLETNTFYLLDEDDAIIFPKNADVKADTLWGFFNNSKADAISTVTKYVALSGIGSEATFNGADCAFAPGEDYILDLNQHYISISGSDNIKLLNGTVKAGSNFVTTDASVDVKAVATADTLKPVAGATSVTVENVVFSASESTKDYVCDSTVDIVFKNCTLDYTLYGNVRANFKNAKNYTFENCVINTNDAVFSVFSKTGANVTFKDCYISSGRGINIEGSGGAVFGNIRFENNTFVCTNPSLNRPLVQFAGNGSFKANSITMINNTFDCSDVAIRIHDGNTAWDVATITLTGNTFGDGAIKIDGDGKDFTQNIADTKFKFN